MKVGAEEEYDQNISYENISKKNFLRKGEYDFPEGEIDLTRANGVKLTTTEKATMKEEEDKISLTN